METRSLVIFLAISIATIESAIINKRDSIPVRVVYEGRIHPSVRNLEEIQFREDVVEGQPLYESSGEVEVSQAYIKGINNLAEKPQLSGEEIKVAIKHLPKPVEPGLEIQQLKSIDETKLEDENETDQQNNGLMLNQIKEIIYNGLDNIHSSVNKLANSVGKPVEEAWHNFNKTIADLLENQQKSGDLKQESTQQPPNQNQNQGQFFQNLVSNFQNAANNFVQNLQQNRPVNGSEDEQTGGGGGWGQNVINSIQGGFQQVFNNINSLTGQNLGSNSSLGDTGVGATTQGSIIGNVVSSFQQIFNGVNQGNPIQALTNQSDTGVGSTQQPGLFQGVINQINQVANNFRPTQPPAGQGDEATTTQRRPVQLFQQIGNQIGSIFGQPTNKPGSEDEQTTQSTNFIQNIGQAIQNANPFRPPQGQQPGGAGTNPITSGAQAVGSQIQQGIQNAVNQSPLGDSTTEKSDDTKKGTTVESVAEATENLATTTFGEKKEIMETTE